MVTLASLILSDEPTVLIQKGIRTAKSRSNSLIFGSNGGGGAVLRYGDSEYLFFFPEQETERGETAYLSF